MAHTPGGHLALITGASSGIGRELARICAQNGHCLALVSRHRDQLEPLAAELRQQHRTCVHTFDCDLGSPAGPDELLSRLARAELVPDIVANSAGFALCGEFSSIDLAAQLQLLQLNITSLTQLTRAIVPGMRARRWGRILNVASVAAYMPGPLMAVYFASKAYVLSFSEAIADELAGTGVSVTALCPGPTRTGFKERAGLDKTLAFRSGVMEPWDVARIGYEAMMKGKRVVIPGLWNKLRMLPVRLVPRRVLAYFARKYHEAG